MNVAEETVDDLTIKTEISFFSLYQLRLKTVVILKYQASTIDSKTLAKVMMHENDGAFCEISTDTAVTVCSVKCQLTQLLPDSDC